MQINSNKNFKITDRILQLLEYKNISKYKFCKDLNLSNGFLDKRRDITTDNYAKILEYFPDVNPTWLLTGEGDMLRPPAGQQQGQPPPKVAQKEEPKPPGCPLCAEKERVIAKQEQIIKDKDKIIALLEGQLSECKAKSVDK